MKMALKMVIAKLRHAQYRKCRRRLRWLAFLIFGFAGIFPPTSSQAGTTNYFVRGAVKAVKPDEHQLVIAHEDIPNFMDAMTMPFRVKDAAILTSVAIGEQITFQLHLTETESWVDHIQPLDISQSAPSRLPALS